tara:strand:+ start:9909 stop:10880 length:972 start_codon:yes stop_codon:yes gene_type:complete
LHGVGSNSGIVPDEGRLGVGGISPDLLVSVSESTTDGLGVANLSTGLEEVLTLEDIFWGKLAKVLLRSHLAGEEGGRKTSTLLHTGSGGGRTSGGAGAEHTVLLLGDGIVRGLVHDTQEVDHNSDGSKHQNLLSATLHHSLYIVNKFFLFGQNVNSFFDYLLRFHWNFGFWLRNDFGLRLGLGLGLIYERVLVWVNIGHWFILDWIIVEANLDNIPMSTESLFGEPQTGELNKYITCLFGLDILKLNGFLVGIENTDGWIRNDIHGHLIIVQNTAMGTIDNTLRKLLTKPFNAVLVSSRKVHIFDVGHLFGIYLRIEVKNHFP